MFWYREYDADTTGKNNKIVRECIENHLKEDEMSQQLTQDAENLFIDNRRWRAGAKVY